MANTHITLQKNCVLIVKLLSLESSTSFLLEDRPDIFLIF